MDTWRQCSERHIIDVGEVWGADPGVRGSGAGCRCFQAGRSTTKVTARPSWALEEAWRTTGALPLPLLATAQTLGAAHAAPLSGTASCAGRWVTHTDTAVTHSHTLVLLSLLGCSLTVVAHNDIIMSVWAANVGRERLGTRTGTQITIEWARFSPAE